MLESVPTMIGCPSCAGCLRLSRGPHDHTQYVCSIGHSFSLWELYEAKETELERTQWSAMALLTHLQKILKILLDVRDFPDAPDPSKIRQRIGQVQNHVSAAGDSLTPGTVYFAPSDHHMLFGASGIELSRGPRVHFVRPAVDTLFVSAAAAFRDRVAGILLTGGGSDGAHGLVTIKEQGGLSIVQRPSEAADPTMPLTGIREDSVDYVASLEELPSLLSALALGQPPVTRRPEPEHAHMHGGTQKGKTDGGRRQEDRKVSESQH